MMEEASPFIKDTCAMVQLEDCYAPFPPQNKPTKNTEWKKVGERNWKKYLGSQGVFFIWHQIMT